eukprot:jgi/Botrbrau1/17474/Bobra.0054s0061.1
MLPSWVVSVTIAVVLATANGSPLRKRVVTVIPTHTRSLSMDDSAANTHVDVSATLPSSSSIAAEAARLLDPYLHWYNPRPARSEESKGEVSAEPSGTVPQPLVQVPGEAVINFTNQPYLAGGRDVPYVFLPGRAAPSPTETAAGTKGLKHPAMIQGLPMPEETGASPLAQVVSVKGQGETYGSGEDGNGEAGKVQGPVQYHGGELLDGLQVFAIYYGCWGQFLCYSNSATPALLQDFVTGLSGSPWLNIVTTYTDASGNALSNRVDYAGSTYIHSGDPCFQGNSLDDDAIFNVVKCVLDAKALRWDPKGWYVVLTSSDVTETSGFCSKYCGWHAHDTWRGNNVRFGFVGSPLKCPNSCMKQQWFSPNTVSEADGMVSILGHEIVETMTDPDGNAWYDDKGYENADKCAWNYGDVSINGWSYYNVGPLACAKGKACTDAAKNEGRYWLIQGNWVNKDKGYCATKYP